MDPRQFLDRAINSTIDFLMERFGTRSPNYVPPSNPVPQPRPTMRDIPFGPYQPLIDEAERVKDALNEQTREKQRIIDRELRGY